MRFAAKPVKSRVGGTLQVVHALDPTGLASSATGLASYSTTGGDPWIIRGVGAILVIARDACDAIIDDLRMPDHTRTITEIIDFAA
jgi:hypothetical protein